MAYVQSFLKLYNHLCTHGTQRLCNNSHYDEIFSVTFCSGISLSSCDLKLLEVQVCMLHDHEANHCLCYNCDNKLNYQLLIAQP